MKRAARDRPSDPSLPDLLDRHSFVLGSNRGLPLVRRPLMATSTDCTVNDGYPCEVRCWPKTAVGVCPPNVRS
jgi:hypothetical protein